MGRRYPMLLLNLLTGACVTAFHYHPHNTRYGGEQRKAPRNQ